MHFVTWSARIKDVVKIWQVVYVTCFSRFYLVHGKVYTSKSCEFEIYATLIDGWMKWVLLWCWLRNDVILQVEFLKELKRSRIVGWERWKNNERISSLIIRCWIDYCLWLWCLLLGVSIILWNFWSWVSLVGLGWVWRWGKANEHSQVRPVGR